MPPRLTKDPRQVDLEDYLQLPEFLRAELRPPDTEVRADARRRAYHEEQERKRMDARRRPVPRLNPRSS